MHQSKLVLLLRTFDRREIRRFDDYLHSPYFGNASDVLRLWEGLKPWIPALPEAKVEKYTFFKDLFGLKNLPDDSEIARMMNALLAKAEHFLSLESMLGLAGEQELQELGAMVARRLDKHVSSSLKQCHNAMDNLPLRDERWHYLRYQLSALELAHLRRNQAFGADALMETMASELDAFYLSARLRIIRERINRQNILATGQHKLHLDAIWNLLESSPAKVADSVQVHAKVLKMLVESENPSHFHDLRSLMRTAGKLLTIQERQEILTNAQNYCIRRIRQGDSEFLRHLFDLYQEALQEGTMMEEGMLSPWKYKNICSVGLQLGEFGWVEDFISSYREKLPDAYRENAHAYNLADLYYHRQEYSKALKMLLQVEFTDLVYALDTRKLQLKIYYEQESIESMLSLIQAFRKWLNRQKMLAADTRKAYLNFISLLHAIWKQSQEGSAAGLVQEIQGTQPLVEEPWLTKMANRS